jgi:hypothetical protein
MTPKEKAKELVDKFNVWTNDGYGGGFPKQCALIAVDEIIEATIDDWSHSDYWEEVKTEIQSL